MKLRCLLPLSVLFVSCVATVEQAQKSRRGLLQAEIYPNPVIAEKVGDRSWRFPFEVSLRESGGVGVTLDGVRAEVLLLGGIRIFSVYYTAADFKGRGFPTVIEPGGNLQYQFAPVREVTQEGLFNRVVGEITVEGTDTLGNRVTTSTRLTVVRKE